ncbi:MAG: PQQ-binding-like beta-propeller repeat protein [Alphaproteobacteria bacterium]|nr:PQQ-binding-like beta-propeller repeat protein [Alphaproteobacteria bacterium]
MTVKYKKTMIYKVYYALPLLLLLAACDSFSKKDPLPGTRHAYLDFGGLAITPDPSLKGQKASVPAPRSIDTFPGALVNSDAYHVPYVAQISENAIWSTSIGTNSDPEHLIFGHPVSDGNFIFTSDAHGKISAIKDKGKEEKGEVIWSFDSIPDDHKDNVACSTLTVHDSTLFVATAIGDVVALDTAKGTLKWRTVTGAPIRVMPAVKDGRVFITGIDGKTVALSTEKGDVLWTHQGFIDMSSIQGGASPVVKDDLVIASYSSGEIYVLKAESGVPLWSDTITTALRSDSIASIPHIVGNPIVEGNILYVISHGGRMAAFDLSTGLTSWQQDIGSIRSPLLIGQNIYIIDNNNRVVCLDKATGKVYWVTALPLSSDDKPLLWTAPIAMNDQLLVTASNGMALSLSLADGSKGKSFHLKDGSVAQPIVVKGHVYMLLESGQLARY